jgi:signal transduction histidine kinase
MKDSARVTPTFFVRMFEDTASGELNVRAFTRHALLVSSFALLLFVVKPIAQWTGIDPVLCALVLSLHVFAYGCGVFFDLYQRYPTPYSTFVAVVNAAVCAAIVALPGRFIAPLWVLYFAYPLVAARAAPLSMLLTLQFTTQPFIVGVLWHALGLQPFADNASAFGAVSLFAFVMYVFLCHTNNIQREGILRLARAKAEEDERQRIANELHDTLGSALAEIALWQGVALHRADDERVRALERVERRTRAASQELRSLVRGLRSGNIDVTDALLLLESRVGGLCEAANVKVTIRSDGSAPIPVARAHHLAKVAEEAVTNAIRHGTSSTITIDVDWCTPRLTIADDGQGFDVAEISPGVGLSSMKQRAQSIGAELSVDSQHGRGTRVSLAPIPSS